MIKWNTLLHDISHPLLRSFSSRSIAPANRVERRVNAIIKSNNDSRTTRPYKQERTSELFRSLIVLNLCRFKTFVAAFPIMQQIAHRLGLSRPFYWAVKETFFKRFAGGENQAELVPLMKKLASRNVGSIVALSIEADLDQDVPDSDIAIQRAKDLTDAQIDLIHVASTQPGSFIAIKLTAFYPPSVLKNWTVVLNRLETSIQNRTLSTHFPTLARNLKDSDYSFRSIRHDYSLLFPNCASILLQDQPDIKLDLSMITKINNEMKRMCLESSQKKVKIIMDAEQSYFQPAIDDLILALCAEYNASIHDDTTRKSDWKEPMIYNSYQAYLTSTRSRLQKDVEFAFDKGYSIGVKLVRGAYLVSENELAQSTSTLSPLHKSLQNTHDSYNSCLDYVLSQIKETITYKIRPIGFKVASHNRESIQWAGEKMKRMGIPVDRVTFGQLMGMQDDIMHLLSQSGFLTFKYIPYGPIEEVLPYLHRRAQENHQIMDSLSQDRSLVVKELGIRLFNRS